MLAEELSWPADRAAPAAGRIPAGSVVSWAGVTPAEPGLGLAELFRRHQTDLVRLAMLLVRSQETAEDIVQDVFTRIQASRSQPPAKVLPHFTIQAESAGGETIALTLEPGSVFIARYSADGQQRQVQLQARWSSLPFPHSAVGRHLELHQPQPQFAVDASGGYVLLGWNLAGWGFVHDGVFRKLPLGTVAWGQAAAW